MAWIGEEGGKREGMARYFGVLTGINRIDNVGIFFFFFFRLKGECVLSFRKDDDSTKSSIRSSLETRKVGKKF